MYLNEKKLGLENELNRLTAQIRLLEYKIKDMETYSILLVPLSLEYRRNIPLPRIDDYRDTIKKYESELAQLRINYEASTKLVLGLNEEDYSKRKPDVVFEDDEIEVESWEFDEVLKKYVPIMKKFTRLSPTG